MRVGVAASFTAEPVAPYLAQHLGTAGIACAEVLFAPFNQVVQACMDPGSAFGERVDTALLLWRMEDVSPQALRQFCEGREDRLQEIVDNAGDLVQAAARMQARDGIAVVVAVPPMPHSPVFDSASLSVGPRLARAHAEVLRRVEEIMASGSLMRLDLAGLAARHGLERAHDWRKWYLYRQPYTEIFWWRIAEDTARVVKASRSARKKCLVLDCDNTIWGGIVGEDGLEGLLLGDDFPGSAFRDFQHQAAALAASGVFVSLCSKNNPEDVWRVFEEHDGMVLKAEHISVAQIGWGEKAAGIAEIARQLNIGLDSVVFVDDSAIEIEKVRSQLPEVTCLLAPEEPVELPLLLPGTGHFDQLRVTDEDRARVTSFKAEVQREEARHQATSPEQFRQTLGLRVKFGPIRSAHFARVVQLINKTNQFNLTTRRRTEVELAAVAGDPAFGVLALDLSDRFGDYGLVGVAIVERKGGVWELDTFLLSCRALGRGVEQAFMAAIRQSALDEGVDAIRAHFLPTAKNQVAAGFLPGLGFRDLGGGTFEATLAELPGADPWVTFEAL